jgi:uncharacterized membrane protein
MIFKGQIFLGNEEAKRKVSELHRMLDEVINALGALQQPPHADSEESAKINVQENEILQVHIEAYAEQIYLALTGKMPL